MVSLKVCLGAVHKMEAMDTPHPQETHGTVPLSASAHATVTEMPGVISLLPGAADELSLFPPVRCKVNMIRKVRYK